MTYRREIDGLRALAVLPVMLCHAHIPGFGGGFVGVDVFFVISGFLITSILLREIEGGDFSLWDFYERRCRRILPPLLLVVFGSALLAASLLTPMEIRSFARSAMWLSFFSSNVGFFRDVGYFDAEAETKPLLHTWTLSVEEQFYLVFPILLLLSMRYARTQLPALLILVTSASMLLSLVATSNEPAAAFYLIPSRAWELGFGSILAVASSSGASFARFRLPQLSQGIAEALAGIGALCIILPVVRYSSATPFPGAAALPPCAGAVLLIWANTGRSTRVGKALSAPWMVGIGLVSYSLYLWHWPLLVFARLNKDAQLTSQEGLVLLIVAAVVSAASFRFVETPLRNRTVLPTRRHVLAGSLASLLAMGVAGYSVWDQEPLAAEIAGEAAVREPVWPEKGVRLEDTTTREVAGGIELRTFGNSDHSADSILILGDSLAHHWIAAAEALAAQHEVVVHLQSIPSCPPLVNTTYKSSAFRPREACIARNRLYADLVEQIDIRHVVLASNWPRYRTRELWVHGTPVPPRRKHAGTKQAEVEARDAQERANLELLERQLDATIQWFGEQDISVWVMLPPPHFPFDVPKRLFRLAREGTPLEASFIATERVLQQRRPSYEVLARVVNKFPHANLMDPVGVLCRDGSCFTVDGRDPLYWDELHLSYHGSRYAARIFDPLVSDIVGARSR